MTIEVQRTVGPLIANEVLWLRRIAPDPEVTMAIRRNGKLSVSWEAGFEQASVDYAELTMALDDFLAGHGKAT